jgi:hypothetical protein
LEDGTLTVFSGVACHTASATNSHGIDQTLSIVGETYANFLGQNSLEKSTAQFFDGICEIRRLAKKNLQAIPIPYTIKK